MYKSFLQQYSGQFWANSLVRILTYIPIGRSPDCAAVDTKGWFVVSSLSSITLSDEEKLDVLRRLDQFRQWPSLDQKRYCFVCGEMITGREIQVIESACGETSLRVVCPTKHCDAMPMEWVLPTEDVLIKIAMVEAECGWLRLVRQAGRAIQSCQRRRKGNTISRTRSKSRPG